MAHLISITETPCFPTVDSLKKFIDEDNDLIQAMKIDGGHDQEIEFLQRVVHDMEHEVFYLSQPDYQRNIDARQWVYDFFRAVFEGNRNDLENVHRQKNV